jgi:hypothetical protein
MRRGCTELEAVVHGVAEGEAAEVRRTFTTWDVVSKDKGLAKRELSRE